MDKFWSCAMPCNTMDSALTEHCMINDYFIGIIKSSPLWSFLFEVHAPVIY